MSIPYERFVHCPGHKLLYNFNKYVCRINVTITIKLIVIGVVVFNKINSFAASSSSASSSSSPPPPPPLGKAMRVAGAALGAALGGASAGVTLQVVGPALLQAVPVGQALLQAVPVGPALLQAVAEGPALLQAVAECPALLQAVAGLLQAVPVGQALLQAAAAALLLAVADPRQRSLFLPLSLQPSMWQTDY